MGNTHNLLFVDDEENILSSLTRLFRREGYGIFTATSGAAGLEILKQQKISLILSDQRMPEMIGAEFLRLSREIVPDAVRIMLTGHSDINAAMEAINNGGVYRFITKPWDDEEIKLTVRDALRNYELVHENMELLELTRRQNAELKDLNQNLEKKVEERTTEVRRLYSELNESFFDAIWAFVGILEVYDHYLGGHSKRVAAMTRAIALEMGIGGNEVDIFEAAALLHDIGLIAAPKQLLTKPTNTLSKDELPIIQQHPILGQEMLKQVANLKPVGMLIRHHHERLSGRGYPDRLVGDDIPIGVRIISLCDTFDELQNKRGSSKSVPAQEVLKIFRADTSGSFDPDVMNILQAHVERLEEADSGQSSVGKINKSQVSVGKINKSQISAGKTNNNQISAIEVNCSISSLKPGMRLSQPIFTTEEKLLIGKESVLTEIFIERLKYFHVINQIDDDVFVYKEFRS